MMFLCLIPLRISAYMCQCVFHALMHKLKVCQNRVLKFHEFGTPHLPFVELSKPLGSHLFLGAVLFGPQRLVQRTGTPPLRGQEVLEATQVFQLDSFVLDASILRYTRLPYLGSPRNLSGRSSYL